MKKVLLDENLPIKLKNRFGEGFEVFTVPGLKWNSLKNGELLKAMAEKGIDFLFTVDKNLKFQQNPYKLPIKIIVLDSPDNRYDTVLPYINKAKQKISEGTIEQFVLITL